MTTAPPEPVAVPVAQPEAAPLPPPPPRVQLLTVTKTMAGVAEVNGEGCASGALVNLMVDSHPIGETTADENGAFTTTFSTGTTPVGQHSVQALCGATLNAVLDIVLVSDVGTPAPALVIILLFLLLIAGLQSGVLTSATKGSVRS